MSIIKKVLIQLAILFSFIFFSLFFSICSTIMTFDPFFNFLFGVANWPSILLKIYPLLVGRSGGVGYDATKALFNPIVILVNSIPWIILGYIILFIVLKRKQRRKVTNRL